MTNDQYKIEEETLIEHLNAFLKRKLAVMFSKASFDKFNTHLIRVNTFYGKLFFNVLTGRSPQLGQFEGMGFKDPVEGVLQGAAYLYKTWREMGLTYAVTRYCVYIDNMVSSRRIYLTPSEIAALPEMGQYVDELVSNLAKFQTKPVMDRGAKTHKQHTNQIAQKRCILAKNTNF